MPRINHEILRWARESAGLSLQEAARAIGLSGENAPLRLAQMEAGEREPTRRQLTKLADKYRRPLLTFYLPAPPAPAPRTHDFRTLPYREPGSEALVEAIVRDVRVRQALVRSALEDMEEEEPLAFVGSMHYEQGAEAIAERLQQVLRFDLAAYRATRTIDEAFRYLRECAEEKGVYVLLMGNLGHYTTNVQPEVFRGFALADPIAPFIVINENDSRVAWAFTLLHELAHVLIGESGISGYAGDEAAEQVCDQAAARVLLPPAELREVVAANLPIDDLIETIGLFARARKISRKMVAYNLLKIRRIGAATYQQLSDRFDADRREHERRAEGAVDYYVVRRHRVGRGLTNTVKRMVAAGALTSTKAGRVLGVKPTAVDRMTAGSQAA